MQGITQVCAVLRLWTCAGKGSSSNLGHAAGYNVILVRMYT